jgi:signal transduction histidine kinase
VVFTLLELFIAFLQDRTLSQTFSAFDNTASVLVFTFMLSVISGKVFASYWSGPVEKMMKRIQRAQKYPEEFSKSEAPDFMALEVKALDSFIMRTIGDLQTANQIKANFMMNMSHDFRTPASGIYALAKSIYKHQEDENLKRPLSMMVESSFQLMNLLQDVLDFSRFSNQKVGLNLTSINLQELIGGIIALMKPKSEEKKLEMRFEMENLEKPFLSDSTLLQRILINLVSNAIKFTECGFISLHAKCKEEKGGRRLIIQVQDSGIGIDPKDHERIFQPFMRLTPFKNTENSGIGLGLSNVKSMLETLNGRIDLRSALGQGATFILEIKEKNS